MEYYKFFQSHKTTKNTLHFTIYMLIYFGVELHIFLYFCNTTSNPTFQ